MNIQKLNNSVSPFAGISVANSSFNKSGISQLLDKAIKELSTPIRLLISPLKLLTSTHSQTFICVDPEITTLNLVCKPFKITFEKISEGEYKIFESSAKQN